MQCNKKGILRYIFQTVKGKYNMEDALKRNIRKLGTFMSIAAVIPLFVLLLPLLPGIIRQITVLIIIICCLLFYLWVLLFGGAVIFALPYKKIFRRLIFIAWLPFYTLLYWWWTTIICMGFMSIYGHV